MRSFFKNLLGFGGLLAHKLGALKRKDGEFPDLFCRDKVEKERKRDFKHSDINIE